MAPRTKAPTPVPAAAPRSKATGGGKPAPRARKNGGTVPKAPTPKAPARDEDFPHGPPRGTALERQHLYALFMQAPAIICVLRGPLHVFELVNPLYQQLVGRRSILGRPIREALPELEGQGFFELLDQVYRTGRPYAGRETLVRLDRTGNGVLEDAYLDFVYQPSRDPGGAIDGILVHATEVTEQVLARRHERELVEELRASEELLRVSQQVSPIGFSYFRVLRDASGAAVDLELRYQNEAAARLNGLASGAHSAGYVVGARRPDIVRSERFSHYLRVADTGEPWKGELRFDDTAFHWLQMTVVRAATDAIVVFSEDVSARKATQEELLSEAHARETLYHFAIALASELDIERIVQLATDAGTSALGAQFGAFFYNVTNAAGESYTLYTLSGVEREAFASFPMPRNTKIFAPTFAGQGIVRSDDITRDPRYGHNAPYHGMPAGHLPVRSYIAVPVTSRTGGVLGGLFFGHSEPGVFAERDERLLEALASQASVAMDNAQLFATAKRERERAEDANRVKDEFLATMSHELRTPLNAMLGWTRLLRTGSLNEEQRGRALETIERNARAQVTLIEDVLDVSRIVTGKLRLSVSPVELLPLVEAALDTARPAADAKGVRLQALLDPDAGTVMGDPNRLQQVVWNLLSNAVKFTPKGGRVHVRLQREDSHVELVVEDSGQGIEPAFLPFVFERFRQADASITRTHGGLGLGLAIVKHLIELHGGTVTAESEGQGHGAAFTVRVPVAPIRTRSFPPGAEVMRPVSGTAPLECPPGIENLRILIVDDEPDARVLLQSVLEHCNARVYVAASATEAFELLCAERPDVLVSDIGMPGEDGYALIRRVRALAPEQGGRTPAVALTAYASAADRTRAIATGFSNHVAKPVEPTELLVVIASLVGRFAQG